MTKSGVFAINYVEGDEIIIEVNSNKRNLNQNRISISGIIHAFDDEFTPGRSGECNNNVNCDEWDEWCNQIRSVLKFYYTTRDCDEPGGYICTGALVNNYYEDFTPYFLTAEHCVDCNIDWDATTVRFNLQSPFCEDAVARDEYEVGGASLLESCKETDVALVRVNNKIPEQYNIYFAGYDTRKRNDMPTNTVVSVHHPRGDFKKISKGDWKAGPQVNFWRVNWYDGIMEPGSSGAPIFEEETKRIISVHSKGQRRLDCDSKEFNKSIGKLRYCWHDGGIQEHLGKGIATLNLDGADPILACQENIELDGIFRDARDYRNERHQITIQANENIVVSKNEDSEFYTQLSVYSSSTVPNPQPNFIIQAGNRIEISGIHTTRINEGSIVRFQIQECIATEEQCGFNYFAKTNNQEENNVSEIKEVKNNTSKTYPNPFSNVIKLEFILEEKAVVSANLYNLQGQLIQQFMVNDNYDIGEHILNLNLQQQISQGIYIFEFCINGECERKQLVRE